MSVLSGEALREYLFDKPDETRLVVTPILSPDEQLAAGSIDIRLGTNFVIAHRGRQTVVDPSVEEHLQDYQERVHIPFGREFVLHPHQFVLGTTLEYFRFPKTLCGHILGRSSWARVGLVIATAVMIQPCFCGSLTLELANLGEVPLKLFPGISIGQLIVFQLDRETKVVESGLLGPIGPELARLYHADFEKMKEISKRLRREKKA